MTVNFTLTDQIQDAIDGLELRGPFFAKLFFSIEHRCYYIKFYNNGSKEFQLAFTRDYTNRFLGDKIE